MGRKLRKSFQRRLCFEPLESRRLLAISYAWTAAGNGLWSATGNWQPQNGYPGSVAGPGNTATINSVATIQLDVSPANQIDSLDLNGSPTLNVDGNSLTTKVLTVDNGAGDPATISNSQPADPSSPNLTYGRLSVGSAVPGSLVIGQNTVVVRTAAGGIADVVGNASVGALTVKNGGSLQTTILDVGAGNTSQGTVTLMGTGSSLTTSDTLYVGEGGKGSVNVNLGARLNTQVVAKIGNSLGAVGSVSVNGASWNARGIMVGGTGTGTLSVAGQGVVSSAGDVQIANFLPQGNETPVTDSVSISGSGSTVVASGSNIFVGPKENGTLNVSDGGVAQATAGAGGINGCVEIDGGSTSSGALSEMQANIDGGTLLASNAIIVGRNEKSIAAAQRGQAYVLYFAKQSTKRKPDPFHKTPFQRERPCRRSFRSPQSRATDRPWLLHSKAPLRSPISTRRPWPYPMQRGTRQQAGSLASASSVRSDACFRPFIDRPAKEKVSTPRPT